MIGIGNADATDTNLLLLSALAPDPAISESAAFRSSHARRESAQQHRRDRPDEAHRDTSRGISSSAGIAFACRCPVSASATAKPVREAGSGSRERVTVRLSACIRPCAPTPSINIATHRFGTSGVTKISAQAPATSGSAAVLPGIVTKPLFWIMIRVPSCWS